jgi:general nucleoside transport system permease protein
MEGALLEEVTGRGLGWRDVILVPLLAVFSAMVIGALIIVLSGETFGTAMAAYAALARGSIGSVSAISETLTAAAPLILAGLAVAIGFRAGLFNIGGEGQILIGGMVALAIGFSFDGRPWFIHLPVAIAGGIVGGGLWGFIPGLLKARTGAHEVIVTIMMNFIALRLVDYLLKTTFFQVPGRSDPVSKSVLPSASLPKLFGWLDPSLRVNAGIILAIGAAWFTHWLLFKSTWGFEFRAVGYNPHAAAYGGVTLMWSVPFVMFIAGAMAGLAGATQTLGVLGRATPGFSAGIGFDAIGLALLGRSHPWGVVAAGVLFGALRAGGRTMQVNPGVSIDIVVVIQALIIVFIAAPVLIRSIYRVRVTETSQQITSGWGG